MQKIVCLTGGGHDFFISQRNKLTPKLALILQQINMCKLFFSHKCFFMYFIKILELQLIMTSGIVWRYHTYLQPFLYCFAKP